MSFAAATLVFVVLAYIRGIMSHVKVRGRLGVRPVGDASALSLDQVFLPLSAAM